MAFDTRIYDARAEQLKPLLDGMVPVVAEALDDDMPPALVAETIGEQLAEHLHTQNYRSDCERLSAACSVYGHAVVRMAIAEREAKQ